MPKIEEVTPLVGDTPEESLAAADETPVVVEENKNEESVSAEAETPVEAEAKADGETAPEQETLTVQIGDAEQEKPDDSSTIREMRQKLREANRQLAEARHTQQLQRPQLGKEPQLEDFDYDVEKFKPAYTSWIKQKQGVEAEQERAKQQAQQQDMEWQQKVAAYGVSKGSLKVPDFDDAESVVADSLSVIQKAAIVKYAKNPALVIYALGKNLGTAQKLSKINDMVEFGIAIDRLEGQLKLTNKGGKTPPAPERKITGNASLQGGDKTLERLRAEAEKTGDISKVLKYKKEQAQKAA